VSTPLTFFGGGRQNHEVLGAFANAQWEFVDNLSLIAGIRWNQETKDAGVTFVRPRLQACSVVQGTCPTTGNNPIPFPTGVEANGFEDRVRFRNLSPKLGLQYEFADSQIYGHWSRGFRSGGFNFRITDVNVFNRIVAATGGNLGFDEEQVDSFELGGKFQTADGSFTLNAAAYVTKIDNMQREVNVAGASGVVQNIVNTADATIKGVDLEARMRVSESLVFTANLGVIDAGYDELLFNIGSPDGITGDPRQSLGLSIPRVSPITVGAGLIHDWDLGSSNILTRVNYQYRDRAAYTDDNLGWLNDLSMLEANITWNTPIEGLSLSIYGRNLLDQVQEGGDTQVPFGPTFPGANSTGVRRPFGLQPTAGTFTPLMRGRNVGIEAMFEF
jgi:iron complex outermembrane receptor protein